MIRPFINTTIYGVIWYQGESNTVINPYLYNCTFPAMINDWREKWYRGTKLNTKELLPFGFVQVRRCFIRKFQGRLRSLRVFHSTLFR